ncbi:MAG: hypothetical protein JRI23_13330 [Deltaproteobacteria bacterium]|jgi:hypothetical protein|nr:hypothetical protein [Deltaproteobacteria bacterium]MBW2532706.1 hypothetical protein [Deltaproteobacteria bacterium]
MRLLFVGLVASVLGWAAPAAAQPAATLPASWQVHTKIGLPMGPNAVACSSKCAVMRTWSGEVALFDGQRWQVLPRLPGDREGKTYGTSVAVTADGKVYVEASGRVGYFDGSAWTMLDLPGWQGPLSALAVLDSGDVVVAGRGRIGLKTGTAFVSHDAGTWRDLLAIRGASLADLWTAGQGGTVMQRKGTGWSRMATGSTAFLSGLHRCGPTCAWAWAGTAGRGYRQSKVALRWDGKSWSDASAGLPEAPIGIAHAPDGARAVTSDHLLRWTGSSWTQELEAAALGKGYHRFVGLCATDNLLIAADHRDAALVRPRGRW